MNNPALYSSACMDWETPEDLIARVHAFAPITLDPATAPDNPTRAAQWIAPPRDGLGEDWLALNGPGGHVWLNPPYGRSLPFWVERVARCGIEHRTLLTPARTDTAWYRRIVGSANAALYLDGRLMFKIRCEPCTMDPDASLRAAVYATRWHKMGGRTIYVCDACAANEYHAHLVLKPIARATFPSLLSYWGHDWKRWFDIFGKLGDFRLLRQSERVMVDSRQLRIFY